ncbi:hypothetical protein EJ377_00875 [Chryseobacterium arthrosphaerae]|uniref:Uncharacterized protein n=1 Tax=Chryseobacterium arthrosphaerae TaxID=651561 RepID=A0A432DYF4_9FLAO|nr:hypothetical protein EJ377_00875 [Chryseobacterium arthrosphaerae]
MASVSHYIKADDIKNAFSDENVNLKVETKNYNEQNLKKSYQVKLSKLAAPDRIFRETLKQRFRICRNIQKKSLSANSRMTF